MFQSNEVKNPIFKYSVLAVGGAAILGIVWLFITFYNAFNIGSGGSEYKVIKATTSPAKNYVAASYVVMGGGAAGWCYKLIKVIKLNEPSIINKEIFKSGCAGEIEVQWIDDTNLAIAHSSESPFELESQWNELTISYSLIESNK